MMRSAFLSSHWKSSAGTEMTSSKEHGPCSSCDGVELAGQLEPGLVRVKSHNVADAHTRASSHHSKCTDHTAGGLWVEAFGRLKWLVGLLVLQSMSSVVLESYKQLLQDHLVVTLFLTMLVGAGGNAGNQSAIHVIRLLATGRVLPTLRGLKRMLTEQMGVGLLLGTGLSIAGFARVWTDNGSCTNAFAISLSLMAIVLTSVVLGTIIPFLLAWLGLDPANAGTTIQVVMDILGVTITCITCHFILVQLAHQAPEPLVLDAQTHVTHVIVKTSRAAAISLNQPGVGHDIISTL